MRRPSDWIVEEPSWRPAENLAWETRGTLANGYLLLRGYPEEPFGAGPTRRCISLDLGHAGTARTTDFLALDIVLAGQACCLAAGRVGAYRRTVDLAAGLLQRRFEYRDHGRTTLLAFERFASIANPHVAGQAVELTPLDWSGRASVWLWFDPRVAEAGGRPMRLLQATPIGSGQVLVATQASDASARIAHAARCAAWLEQSAPPRPSAAPDRDRVGLRYDLHLERGQRAVVERVVATYVSSDVETVSAERSALEEVRDTRCPEYGTRRRRHVRAWRRRWLRVEPPPAERAEDRRAVRYAVFHLVQACPPRRHAPFATAPFEGGVADSITLLPFLCAFDAPAARATLARLGRAALAPPVARSLPGAAVPTPADLAPLACHCARSAPEGGFRRHWFVPLVVAAARTWARSPLRESEPVLAAWTLRTAAREIEEARRRGGSPWPADEALARSAEPAAWRALARQLTGHLPASPLRTLALSALIPGSVPMRVLRTLARGAPPGDAARVATPRLPALLAIAFADLGDWPAASPLLQEAGRQTLAPPGTRRRGRLLETAAALWLAAVRTRRRSRHAPRRAGARPKVE